MTSNPESRYKTEPRIRLFVARPTKRSILDFILLALSIFFSIMLMVSVFATLGFGDYLSNAPGIMPAVLLIVGLVSCFAPAILFIVFSSKYAKYKIARKLPLRYERLMRLSTHPQTPSRLPHRLVEWSLFGASNEIAAFRSVAKQLPPGNVIVAVPKGVLRIQRPDSLSVGFEPIDIDHDEEQMYWLHCHADPKIREKLNDGEFDPTNLAELYENLDEDSEVKENKSVRSTISFFFLTVLAVGVMIVFMLASLTPLLFTGYVIVKAIRDPTAHNIAIAFLPFALLSIGFLLSLFRKKSIYLIPGGVAIRITRFVGRKADLYRLTPDNASMIIDYNSSRIFLVDDKSRMFEFTSQIDDGTLLLSWFSKAETPTESQLRLLLDPHGKPK